MELIVHLGGAELNQERDIFSEVLFDGVGVHDTVTDWDSYYRQGPDPLKQDFREHDQERYDFSEVLFKGVCSRSGFAQPAALTLRSLRGGAKAAFVARPTASE